MSQNETAATKKTFSLDWLVRGTLTKLGDMFDSFTGRSWKPSSSLATSELIERLKKLLDAEARDFNGNQRFVPHHIKLKMQWDKFSVDSDNSEKALKTLETELLIAAVDHINDRRYHTYAPIQLEIKPDYFTEGIKLEAGFDKFVEYEHAGELNITFPDLKNVVIAPPVETEIEEEKEFFVARFTLNNEQKNIIIAFTDGQRKRVGRTKDNDLWIDDPSVSKIHAAFVLNSKRKLMVADTGSTNGTFVSGQRIPYGKAILVNSGEKLMFGTVEVVIEHFENTDGAETFVEKPKTETNISASENNASNSKETNLSPEKLSASEN